MDKEDATVQHLPPARRTELPAATGLQGTQAACPHMGAPLLEWQERISTQHPPAGASKKKVSTRLGPRVRPRRAGHERVVCRVSRLGRRPLLGLVPRPRHLGVC